MSTRAICLRCGGNKGAPERICPHCGHRPDGEGLLVAWLLSDAHLSADKLDAAAQRIRQGASIRPSDAMLDKARIALGTHADSDEGLTQAQRLGLLATSLVLTPMVGWTLWLYWRGRQPRRATQALWLSMPISILFFVGVVYAVLAPLSGS